MKRIKEGSVIDAEQKCENVCDADWSDNLLDVAEQEEVWKKEAARSFRLSNTFTWRVDLVDVIENDNKSTEDEAIQIVLQVVGKMSIASITWIEQLNPFCFWKNFEQWLILVLQ